MSGPTNNTARCPCLITFLALFSSSCLAAKITAGKPGYDAGAEASPDLGEQAGSDAGDALTSSSDASGADTSPDASGADAEQPADVADASTGSQADTGPDAGDTGNAGPDVAPDAGPDALPLAAPTAGQLVITEIMADSMAAIAPAGLTSDDVGEWVELYNVTDQPLDLVGCLLSDTKNTELIGAHVVVTPHMYVTLARNAPGFAADYTYAVIKFSDSGDRVAISCGGVFVDVVNFATGFPLMQGATLSLSPERLDAAENDSAVNWCNGTSPYNTTSKGVDRGTPGKANTSCP